MQPVKFEFAGRQIALSRWLHIVSAAWTMVLTILILLDVLGRSLLSNPIPGTKEIIQNSIVCITFLQLPLAIYSGSMLRTTVLIEILPAPVQRMFRTGAGLLGFLVFIGLLWSTFPSFMDAYAIGEYEGEGALRVPTWPVRGLVLVMSIVTAFAYLTIIVLDWQNKLIGNIEARGAIEDSLNRN